MMGALTYFMLEIKIYVELIGFLAVFFEAMLGAPQFYRNYQNRSTKGMRQDMLTIIIIIIVLTCGFSLLCSKVLFALKTTVTIFSTQIRYGNKTFQEQANSSICVLRKYSCDMPYFSL